MAKTTNTTTDIDQRIRTVLLSGLMIVTGVAGLGLAYMLLSKSSTKTTTTTTTTAAATIPVVTASSGTLANGSTITIKGTDFGTKVQAAPLKWDDFEGGTNGSTLTGWSLDSTGTDPAYSNTTVANPQSTLSAKAGFPDGSWSSNFGIVGTPLPRIFFDTWYFYDAATPPSRNHKLFRIHSNTYSPNLYLNVYCTNGIHISQDGLITGPEDPHAPYAHKWLNFSGATPTKDEGTAYLTKKWTHLQGYFEESSGTDANDGTAILWVDGELVLNQRNSWYTRKDTSTYWNTFLFGNYLGHDAAGSCAASGDANTYWDNTYFDTTRAHVEIGNASTYTASTLREIQPATSWNTGTNGSTIQFTLNQGGFPDLTNPANEAWVYVTDANGSVNETGYKLINGDTIPPTVTIDEATGSTVSTSIHATAADASGIKKVEFYRYRDTVPFATDLDSPYEASIAAIPDGGQRFYAKAYDQAGNSALSQLVYMTVDHTLNSTPPSTAPPDSGCFTADTLVNTPFGMKPISLIHAGDTVYSYDQATDRTVIGIVTQLLIHPNEPYGVVTFSDGSSVQVTAVHRFYNPSTKEWKAIGEMKIGDTVFRGLGATAHPITIKSMEFTSGRGAVHNLEVGRYHTYYVNGVLVHNSKKQQTTTP